MVSSICSFRNDFIIPRLLEEHDKVPRDDRDQGPVDMSTAENAFMKQKVLRTQHERPYLSLASYQLDYAEEIGGSIVIRERLSALFNEHISPDSKTSASELVLGAGAQCTLDALIEALCDPGDGVMIATPYWSGLDLSISIRNNAKVIPVNIPLEQFFDVSSVDYYERAFKSAVHPVKAVLVCNPHNPLGRCYPRATLEAIWGFSQTNELHYISDEVYALSFHGVSKPAVDTMVSAAGLHPSSGMIHVIYSLSKDFGCNGIRVGSLLSRSAKVRMCVALSTHGQISSLAIPFVDSVVLTDSMVTTLFTESRTFMEESRNLVTEFLDGRGIKFIPATAGLFVFAKLCLNSTDSERSFIMRLCKQGIVLASGTSYHCQELGWFRICFAVERSKLRAGLVRLGYVLDELDASGAGENDQLDQVEPRVRVDRKRKLVALDGCDKAKRSCVGKDLTF
ncbi:1-aminocyclopropane-1-carboxylate synthase-like protein 1 [Pleomassaria siparia CBS 279.74]|uniref:1-aminocyclopropane-1-carboxylate synthase-like protein 1 n=1 Tax=Pleomassaria siparia CBS 279.74 TaxID=1314801 RepID=A0A6G1KFC9_9PLEO|nr:1-aminocyclopropane-1-carboxylate synthase-like protein 1 [Pleomassaria siparia CBS 279.74]